jgi:diguanylate cyclase (GGDEF)-like protein
MARIADPVASRITGSLSTLLRKPLTLAGCEIVSDVPLLDEERAVVRDLMDLVRVGGDLEARVEQLQRENIELIMKNRVLAEVSARDALTGLYNRCYVMEKIESEMNRSLRHGSPVALLMLDIDHFKRINDSFGHAAGDSVLKSFGQVLRESCRVYDVPGRYGGEEFCIVLPETRIGNTTAVAERIRQRLAESRFDVGSDSVSITASMGIAGMDSVAEEGIVTSAALIDRADRALYSAKHHGRDRIEVWGGETNH